MLGGDVPWEGSSRRVVSLQAPCHVKSTCVHGDKVQPSCLRERVSPSLRVSPPARPVMVSCPPTVCCVGCLCCGLGALARGPNQAAGQRPGVSDLWHSPLCYCWS